MRLLLLLLLPAALLLAACAEDPPDPRALDPGAMPPTDTVITPLGVPDPGLETTGRVTASAEAALEPVGGSGVRGRVQLHQVADGIRVVAEVGGGPDGERRLRVLARRDCADPSDTRPLADGDLGTVAQAFDGTGQHQQVHPSLMLEGDRSVVGHAAAVLSGGGDMLACGVIRSAS